MARSTMDPRPARATGVARSHGVPPVRDLARTGRTYEVEFHARASYDFLISLTVGDGVEADLLPDDRAWLERTRRALAPTVLADVDASFGDASKGLFHGLATLIVDHAELADPVELVAYLDGMSAVDVAEMLLQ